MKATEMLNKVKELVGVEASNEVTLAQATLENGTVIESENFEAGNEVFIITEDEKVALPIGDYTLEDGEMLKVEEEGVISSIGAAEEVKEEESEEVEAAEEEKEEMKYATKEDLAEVKAMIDEIKSMLDPKKEEEMSEDVLEEKVDEVKEELSSVEEPVAKVTHNPETETKKNLNLFAQKRTMTTADRVLQRISNIKK